MDRSQTACASSDHYDIGLTVVSMYLKIIIYDMLIIQNGLIPQHHNIIIRQLFYSTVVERPFLLKWVIGSILHDRSIGLFLVSANAPQLFMVSAILSVKWCIKRSLAANL